MACVFKKLCLLTAGPFDFIRGNACYSPSPARSVSPAVLLIMGYCAQPFAVDLDKVRRVLGSNDTALIETIKSANLYDTYASQSEGLDYGDMLHDMIVNGIRPVVDRIDRKESGGFLGLFKRSSSVRARLKRDVVVPLWLPDARYMRCTRNIPFAKR